MSCLTLKSAYPQTQSSDEFHIETSFAKQMTGFYVKRNTGLKWVNPVMYDVEKMSKDIWKPCEVHSISTLCTKGSKGTDSPGK